MKLINRSKGTIICSEIYVVQTYYDQVKGLIGKRNIHFGLLFPHLLIGIHTFGMLEPIDVIVFDQKKIISKMLKDLRPHRIYCYWGLNLNLIELPFGSIDNSNTDIGDEIEISE